MCRATARPGDDHSGGAAGARRWAVLICSPFLPVTLSPKLPLPMRYLPQRSPSSNLRNMVDDSRSRRSSGRPSANNRERYGRSAMSSGILPSRWASSRSLISAFCLLAGLGMPPYPWVALRWTTISLAAAS